MIYIDYRDWQEYNAKLVQRGEFHLDSSCVKNWWRELKSNCIRQPRPKGLSMLRVARRPVFGISGIIESLLLRFP
jgi:hypothetical protein